MRDSVAAAVVAQFAALPKTGKPQAHEHTVLAGIALSLPPPGGSLGSQQPAEQQAQQPLEQRAQRHAEHAGRAEQGGWLAVVAIGTGTKCLGGSKRQAGGASLNDCHAEVLCRRALLRWLYSEMQQAVQQYSQAVQQAGSAGAPHDAAALAAAAGTRVLRLVPPARAAVLGSSSGDVFGGWRFALQPGVRVHMYVSQPPCGDASILAGPAVGGQPAGEQGVQGICAAHERPASGASSTAAGSFGRTGAKPLKRPRSEGGTAPPGAAPPAADDSCGQEQAHQQCQLPQQHEVEAYGEAQATGVVRRKPGRGDATLSMSCSDKLARWCLLGFQGSLLSGLLASPLHLASITISLQPTADASGAVDSTPAASVAPTPVAAPGPAALLAGGEQQAPGAATVAAPAPAAALTGGEQRAPAAATVAAPAPAASLTGGEQREPAAATVAAALTGGEQQALAYAAAPGSSAGELAGEAQAALHRALLGRTAALAQERLPAGARQAAPSLHIHSPGEAQAGWAGAPVGSAALPPVQGVNTAASRGSSSGSPSSSSSPGGGGTSPSAKAMQELGLAPSATRRVGGGSSVVWVAPPSPAFKWKQQRPQQPQQHQQHQQQQQPQQQPQQQQQQQPQQQPQQQQEQRQQQQALGDGSHAPPAAAPPAPAPAAAPWVLLCGAVEAVAGSNGLKVGAVRPKAGLPAAPSVHPSVSKAALFAAWQQLATALRQLPVPAAAAAAGGAADAHATAELASGGGTAAPAAAAAAADLTYRQAKQLAGVQYRDSWRRLLQPPSPFEGWIPKPPSLEDFSLTH